MPTNAEDVATANAVVALGHPVVAPVMPDMVRWMRVAESPVADTFARFFAEVGAPAVSVILEGLMRENCWLRHRAFCQILPKWPPDLIPQLRDVLTMVATQPDAYDNDLRSIAILTEHRLAEADWLKEWVAFKKGRMATRSDLLRQVERQLSGLQQTDEPNGAPPRRLS
jgi:hypothetical protein